MTADRAHTVAFSGHRSFKMDLPAGVLAARLQRQLRELAAAGYDTFLSGMAEGFDLLAAREVVRLREEMRIAGTPGPDPAPSKGLNPAGGVLPAIRLIAVVPFPGQADRFPAAVRREYDELLASADERVTISQEYDPGVYHRRNDFLLEHCSRMVFCYNGSPGGTRYCWRQATSRGLRPINLCAEASERYLL